MNQWWFSLQTHIYITRPQWVNRDLRVMGISYWKIHILIYFSVSWYTSWWLYPDVYCHMLCIVAPIAITWTNVDSYLCPHMASLGHSVLKVWMKGNSRTHFVKSKIYIMMFFTRNSNLTELEQLECLHSKDTTRRPMIIHTIESYWIPSQKKTKSKLQILRICQNLKLFNFETNITRDTPSEVAW